MFLLVFLLLQFNNSIALRPDLLGLPLTSGETCEAKVQRFDYNSYRTPLLCPVYFKEDECGQDVKSSTIKDCPQCGCLNGRWRVDEYNISVIVPKINPEILNGINWSGTFQVAGLTINDGLYYLSIGMTGISLFGLAQMFPKLLIAQKIIFIGYLVSFYFIFTTYLSSDIVSHTILSLFYSWPATPLTLMYFIPKYIFGLPSSSRRKEIEAIQEIVFAFEKKDLLYE